MLTAITRAVSPAIVNCELSFIDRQPIDLVTAQEQHHAYEDLLGKLGARVISLPAEPDLPDSIFVEDPAIVLDELAVILPLGTGSRAPRSAPQECFPAGPAESPAANALALGGTVIFPASFPRTRARLEGRGFHVTPLDIAELQKAESGLTCSSLLFETAISARS